MEDDVEKKPRSSVSVELEYYQSQYSFGSSGREGKRTADQRWRRGDHKFSPSCSSTEGVSPRRKGTSHLEIGAGKEKAVFVYSHRRQAQMAMIRALMIDNR